MCHGAKKLRSALRAMTARFLVFGPVQKYSSLACWTILYELWIDNPCDIDIRRVCMKSAVDYKDRQDPSLPYEVTKLRFMIDELNNKKTFMSLYLELISFLMEAFLEHNLTVVQRIFRIWYVKSLLRIWRIWLNKHNLSVATHFLASETYTDINIVCDGFLCLLLYCHKNDLWFCPQFFSSDHCEQAFAYCRIGRYIGRRTNISGSDIISGLERRNRSIELESISIKFEAAPIAHARTRTVMDMTKGSTFTNERARVVEVSTIIDVMNQATNYAAFVASQLDGVVTEERFLNEEIDTLEAEDIVTSYNLLIGKERLLQKLSTMYDDNKNIVSVAGVKMGISTSMAIYGNGGRTSLPSASRASRFFGYVFQEISLDIPCPLENSNHRTYRIGDRYECSEFSGKILALAFKKTTKGLTYPAKTMCQCTGAIRVGWVKAKKGVDSVSIRFGSRRDPNTLFKYCIYFYYF